MTGTQQHWRTNMDLRVVGAGLPRTGTSSLKEALERLFDEPCAHMAAIPGHPFELGASWDRALAGEAPDWGPAVRRLRRCGGLARLALLARVECGEPQCGGAPVRARQCRGVVARR